MHEETTRTPDCRVSTTSAMPFASVITIVQRARGLQHGAAILRHAHQVEVFGEQTLQRLGDQPVIIGEQHPRAIHAPALRSGTHATTVVPWPGALSMSSSPPSRRTRSRMLI